MTGFVRAVAPAIALMSMVVLMLIVWSIFRPRPLALDTYTMLVFTALSAALAVAGSGQPHARGASVADSHPR